MTQLNADDLALAIEIKRKKAEGYSTKKEETELTAKVKIADQIGDEMNGHTLDAEIVMIEMTALIVAITVGIHSPQAHSQAMLVTGLILQRIRDNSQDVVAHSAMTTH